MRRFCKTLCPVTVRELRHTDLAEALVLCGHG